MITHLKKMLAGRPSKTPCFVKTSQDRQDDRFRVNLARPVSHPVLRSLDEVGSPWATAGINVVWKKYFMKIICLAILIMGSGLRAMDPVSTVGLSTRLVDAAQHGNELEARRLILLGASVNFANEGRGTPLMAAAQRGNLKIVQTLLNHGANVNAQAKKKNNVSALFCAAEEGHDEIVQLLLDKGALPNPPTTNGATPLMMAAQQGYLRVVQILLDHGANINAQAPDEGNQYALNQAALQGHDAIIELLLDYGAAVDLPLKNGATPLIVAARRGHLRSVQILLNHGANVNAQAHSLNNMFALGQAAGHGHLQVVEILLTSISNADATAMRDSYFALHRLMGRRGTNASRDIRKLISDRFINALVQERMKRVSQIMALQDSDGDTARLIAFDNNHPEIADLLDPKNQKSQERIRTLIEANVRQAVKSKPLSKYPPARGISWDEAFGEFESKEEEPK
jgi:ankyrin repeat protein